MVEIGAPGEVTHDLFEVVDDSPCWLPHMDKGNAFALTTGGIQIGPGEV